jgi:hypothetical protein
MAPPKGNQFWKARSSHGRKPIWEDPEVLREACLEYVQWVEDNPLGEAITYQGEVMSEPVPKMRAMTIGGMCVFLGIIQETWQEYRKKDGFTVVTREIDEIIRMQKFEGAAAGMLNPNIIARDLGLIDKKELGSDPDRPIRAITTEMAADEATALYKSMIDD